MDWSVKTLDLFIKAPRKIHKGRRLQRTVAMAIRIFIPCSLKVLKGGKFKDIIDRDEFLVYVFVYGGTE